MTFYNEKPSVVRFFEDLRHWTCLPDEIVMVDGGSNDGTVEAVKEQATRCSVPVKLIEEQRCNVPRGRNIAIANARHELLAVTDMGCTIAPDWLERILQPFESDPSVDVVAGYYEPICHEPIQYCYHYLTYNPQINRKFWYPSSRSLALRKKVWEAVGGYPEHIIAGEDTLFDVRIREHGFNEAFQEDARVFWEVKKTYGLVYHQFYRYARGSGRAWVTPHIYGFYIGNFVLLALWIVLAVAVHPALWIIAAGHFAFYSWFRIFRKAPVREHLSLANIGRFYALTLVIDAASAYGYLVGIGKWVLGIDELWGPAKDKQPAPTK